jgi:hypothetical protein
MDIIRLGVVVHPAPTLSVEFRMDGQRIVWKTGLSPLKSSVDEAVLELKRVHPRYLSQVSSRKLARLVKFAARVRIANDVPRKSLVDRNDQYDYQIDLIDD